MRSKASLHASKTNEQQVELKNQLLQQEIESMQQQVFIYNLISLDLVAPVTVLTLVPITVPMLLGGRAGG